MLKPLLLIVVLATLPLAQQAQAVSINLLPGVSLQIGEQDRNGNYWDGYDWRDRQWWQGHQGQDVGERSRRGHYWDGHRWRDKDWWKKNYYYHDGRYWKYDKHAYKKYKKQQNKHHGRHHHHDHDD
ncbi:MULTISPECIES: DUF2502 domain-containing protein [Yersinia]|uniref:DUF2502 domain-containing protein n=1 Tax=Yersinia TaxID=629 RepID=UPI0007E49594|nr:MULTISPECIES: DUF2502 domain-containing protein [Yersinia]OWF90110.1 hypothetical protein B4914_00980 [Yersinia entomophaga]